MPLRPGRSKSIILTNYKELLKTGRSPAQSWAIAYDKAGLSRRKKKPKK